ncbi:TetR family transcriptional regulator, partial [Cellulomonas bogoriensis 69B4 = DSM 16987]
RVWCTLPSGAGRRRDHRPRAGEVRRLATARGGDVVTETWGEGPVVYLMHGWGGWRGQLGAFVEPLVAAGHQVVAFDAPGHGDADPGLMGAGYGTLVEMTETLELVHRTHGPAAGIVAHSLSCVAAASVVRAGVTTERLVLIAPGPGFDQITRHFTGALGLSDRTRAHLDQQVLHYTGHPVTHFSLPGLGADGAMPPTLVVHDRHDKETAHAIGAEVAATWPDATLLTTEGLGHHRLLADPATVAAVTAHLTAARALQEHPTTGT